MLRLDHVGIGTRDAAAVARLLERLLGLQTYKQERLEEEGVVAHFLRAGGAKLELLEALGPESPLDTFLAKRGEGVHHLAFEVADIRDQMQRVREAGFTPLSAAPRRGADNKLIFFLHPKETHGVLIEFCQRSPEALRRRPTVVLFHAGEEPLREALALRCNVLSFHSDDAADDILGALDHGLVEEAHLVGAGAGGPAALLFALRHPLRTKTLAVRLSGGDAALFSDDPRLTPQALGAIRRPVLVSAADHATERDVALGIHDMLPHSRLSLLPASAKTSLLSSVLLHHMRSA